MEQTETNQQQTTATETAEQTNDENNTQTQTSCKKVNLKSKIEN